jgi:hypothetical protein
MALNNEDGVTRVTAASRSATERTALVTTRAAITTATTDLAAVKTAVDAFVVGGSGLTAPQTTALQTQVNTATTSLAAILTALNASGLPNA